MKFYDFVSYGASLSAGKNYKTKKIPCKLILYGGFLFLVHSKISIFFH